VNNGDTIAHLGRPRRIWAVSACQGAAERLDRIHLTIARHFTAGDRLLYFGNCLGGTDSAAIIDRLLAFRTYLLSAPGMMPTDFIYLRGVQEEIWSRLLLIQFAPNPQEVLRWMLDRGGAATLEAYGGSAKYGLAATREGAMAMTRWTNELRDAIRRHPGHDKYMSVLQRAALTDDVGSGSLLFVHAGVEPARPLEKQGDAFWWGAGGFARLTTPFERFTRIFRGSDPSGRGLELDGYGVTLDGRNGNGGALIAAAIMPDGHIADLIEA